MPKFRQTKQAVNRSPSTGLHTDTLIAQRYVIQKKLGSGSFGTVFLVLDKKVGKEEEELKVLKEISVGNLKPNETVQASTEAQLLSKLDHPSIVKFYSSFLEQDSFCIVTEYCEGKDLECKIEEYKKAGKLFPEIQIIDWFLQLLLGVHYIHNRNVLHRDLKTKNIFLKNSLIKIGDFGVSRLLMGSCDLATTFTGTPYYMSPEVLRHQGYDSKADIWSLACILYEICSLEHAFSGHSFLTVVLKIVEGETPSLPSRYSPKLNSIMQSMLHKDPSDRPSASELLKIPYIAEKLENIKSRFSNMTLKDKTINIRQDSEEIFDALQKKFHLQTLRDITEIQKMTPRERMRLRKQIAADKRAERLKMLAEAQCQENHKRKQERRARNFLHASIDVLCDGNQDHMTHSQPVTVQEYKSVGQEEVNAVKMADRMCMTEPVDQDIPDDPIEAETYYYEDNFDSCNETSTEEDEENEDKEMDDLTMQTIFKTCQQGSDVNALIRCMEGILDGTSLGSETVTSMSPAVSMGPSTINNAMAEMKLQRMKESAIEKLGKDVFNKVYEYLKKARQKNLNEMVVKEYLGRIVSKPSDCFEVDQLLYYEEQLRTPH